MSRLTKKRIYEKEVEVKKRRTDDGDDKKSNDYIKPLKDLWNFLWSKDEDENSKGKESDGKGSDRKEEESDKGKEKDVPMDDDDDDMVIAAPFLVKSPPHRSMEAFVIGPMWVSATKVKNYLLRDPVLDWYESNPKFLTESKIYQKFMPRCADKASEKRLPLSADKLSPPKDKSETSDFAEYIQNQGVEFEKQLIPLLKIRVGENNVAVVNGDFRGDYYSQFTQTIDLMRAGKPLIHGGVLMDAVTQLYGIPDLIVRSDYLQKIVNYVPGNIKDLKNGAPLLGHKKYHYRIVDIKFMTLPLRSDGAHLLNSGYIPAYKGQLYIYNDILSGIQGYNPDIAYLLGRRWKYTYRSEPMSGYSCLDKLGVIDFCHVDEVIPSKVRAAITWVRDVREYGDTWEIKKLPLGRPELYPNMSNHHDGPWHPLKQEIASKIKEITSLWMCGTKHREIAHYQGIYSWNDKRCIPTNIGIKSEKKVKILSAIIKTNQNTRCVVAPKVIKNNERNWQTPDKIEFFVDFETLNDIYQDFDTLPSSEISPINIFMIGVGYLNKKGEWRYKDFTCRKISTKEEKRICMEFADFIKKKSKQYKIKDPLLYHWSKAEVHNWNTIYNKYGPSNRLSYIDDGFFDLLEVFHDEPITIKGCMAFGLKEVARAMYHRKLIKVIWDEDNPCSNGPDAMLLGFKAYQQAHQQKIDVLKLPAMKDIIKYNNMDCAVLCEIINYLRKHHT